MSLRDCQPEAGEPAASGSPRVEWITVALFAAAYGAWALGVALYPGVGPVGLILIAGVATTLQASLQHEALHGHPTRNAAINEGLAFWSLNLLFPYRRFKELHLKHHCDDRLTDPYDDPESWYVAERDHAQMSAPMRLALRVNATLVGRFILGPSLSAVGLWRADWRDYVASGAQRRAKLRDAYLRHAVAVLALLAAADWIGGVDPLTYLLCVSWPGVALLMLRTYVEHRAEAEAAHRTAIVEAEPALALLFLNNNLHAVHHAEPRLPWYALPAVWRARRAEILAENGGYYIPSYWAALCAWGFRPRLSVTHPSVGLDMAPAPVSAPAVLPSDRAEA